MLFAEYRTMSRASSSVGNTKGLMEVQVTDIAELAW